MVVGQKVTFGVASQLSGCVGCVASNGSGRRRTTGPLYCRHWQAVLRATMHRRVERSPVFRWILKSSCGLADVLPDFSLLRSLAVG